MKIRRILGPAVLGLVCLTAVGRPAQADLVTYYNFNDAVITPGEGIGSNEPLNGPTPDQTTELTYSPAGISSFELVDGTTLNALGDDEAGQALAYNGLDPDAGGADSYFQFAVDLTKYKDPILSFAAAAQNGSSTAALSYSVDGGENFTSFGPVLFPSNPDPSSPLPYDVTIYDLSAEDALDGAAEAIIRFGGFYSDGGDMYMFDNIQLNATPNAVPTPEPETWAMMGLGLAAVAFLGWKRRRSLAPMSEPILA